MQSHCQSMSPATNIFTATRWRWNTHGLVRGFWAVVFNFSSTVGERERELVPGILQQLNPVLRLARFSSQLCRHRPLSSTGCAWVWHNLGSFCSLSAQEAHPAPGHLPFLSRTPSQLHWLPWLTDKTAWSHRHPGHHQLTFAFLCFQCSWWPLTGT